MTREDNARRAIGRDPRDDPFYGDVVRCLDGVIRKVLVIDRQDGGVIAVLWSSRSATDLRGTRPVSEWRALAHGGTVVRLGDA